METYTIPHCNSYVKSDQLKATPLNLFVAENQEMENDPSHLYARVDGLVAENEEISTQENNAYESSSTYKSTKISSDNFHCRSNSDKIIKKRTSRMETCRHRCMATCATLMLLMVTVALAEASLALALVWRQTFSPSTNYSPAIQQKGNASSTHNTTAALTEIEQIYSQIKMDLEKKIADLNASYVMQQNQLSSRISHIATLATAVQQLLNNKSEMARLPPGNPGLRNCSTTIEASCTVGVQVGRCITSRVPTTRENSIVVHSSCVRTNSNEQTPLVGVVDATDNQLECLCYVIEIDGVRRSHPTRCNLLVTRCETQN